jgi:hypothetical protein
MSLKRDFCRIVLLTQSQYVPKSTKPPKPTKSHLQIQIAAHRNYSNYSIVGIEQSDHVRG